ncbi:TOBE domain-containing protein [Leisingera caerulea]|uniref:TOBE domain-containing protein n=1 Tax=Leisingera caerulea TaxID=506591 RepID=UPI003F4AB6C0
MAIPGRVIHGAFHGETTHYYLELENRTDPLIASVTNFERPDLFEIGDAVWPDHRVRLVRLRRSGLLQHLCQETRQRSRLFLLRG